MQCELRSCYVARDEKWVGWQVGSVVGILAVQRAADRLCLYDSADGSLGGWELEISIQAGPRLTAPNDQKYTSCRRQPVAKATPARVLHVARCSAG